MLQAVGLRSDGIGISEAVRALPRLLLAEQDRWFLWVPVLFASGIWIYFALPNEPSPIVAAVPVACAIVLALVWRESGAAVVVTSAALAASIGFAAAKWRSDRVAAPVLANQIGPSIVRGWIELVEPRPERGQRITVRVADIEGLARADWPRRVRVRLLASGASALSPGEAVRFSAVLSPPAGPALPDGFDFARSAWFQGLGGVGYTRSAIERVDLDREPDWDVAGRGSLERVRQAVGARIVAALPGETGAIATALITGERGGISERTNTAFRDSGLFHIMSISGLHMVVMAGAVFLTVRFLLSLVPILALRAPIKKWAATSAAAAALGYLLLLGASTPTVRSWIMISIMYLAVLLDRPAVALRNVALTALVILAIWPESLVDVGFQMSFAAVVALVAAYERVREREDLGRAPRGGPLWRGLLALGGIITSTLIASLAVAPIAAFHFHVSQQYAILANLIAIPICNLVVMPAALATLVAMPLGLEAWPLVVMGLGIEGMVWCAYAVAALPGAVGRLPAFSVTAFALMVVGGIWLALWQRRWRLLGIVPILAGLAFAGRIDRPDILLGRNGRLMAVRADDGRLAAIADSAGHFDLARWLEHDGDARRPEAVLSTPVVRCDWAGCTAVVRGMAVALNRHPAGLGDDCRRARILITTTVIDSPCGVDLPNAPTTAAPTNPQPAERERGSAGLAEAAPPQQTSRRQQPSIVVRGPELARAGALAIRVRPDGRLDIRTVADAVGQRPWARPSERSTRAARQVAAPTPSFGTGRDTASATRGVPAPLRPQDDDQ